jgi:hypothetical protein
MRRTILSALVAAVLLVPSAAHAAGPTQIFRDCQDGSLQGNYTASELRDARSNMPTDIDEYSDCRDVLSRAIAEKTASSNPTPTPTPAGGDQSGGGGGTGSGGGTGTGGGTGSSRSERDEAALSAPSSPQDAAAVASAYNDGDKAFRAELDPKSPGQARLTASVGRNGLPATMIAVLALLAATLVAACLPLLRRRRVLPHPSP